MTSPADNRSLLSIPARPTREPRLEAMRRVAEYAVATASLLFLVAAAETFFPATTGMIERSLAAAGTSLLALLKAL